MTKAAPRCLWCNKPLEPSPGNREQPLFCLPAHRARYKRAEKAAELSDLVEKLGPHVDAGGIFIYKELVDHLAGRVNEPV